MFTVDEVNKIKQESGFSDLGKDLLDSVSNILMIYNSMLIQSYL
jgi:hypothetical protein